MLKSYSRCLALITIVKSYECDREILFGERIKQRSTAVIAEQIVNTIKK